MAWTPQKTIMLLLFWTLGLMAPAAFACTTIQVNSKNGDVVIGRTLDFGYSLKTQFKYYPAGTNYHTTLPNGEKGRQWQAKYSFVGISAKQTPNGLMDGVNEKGLAAESLLFPVYADYGSNDIDAPKDQIMLLNDFFVYILSRFDSVDQVEKNIQDLHLWAKKEEALHNKIPQLHFMVHDKQGHNLVIEYSDNGELHTYKDKADVMTNSPDFRWHLINMKQYFNLTPYTQQQRDYRGQEVSNISQGNGFFGLPGDFTSSSRFTREFMFLRTALKPDTHKQAVRQAMHITNSVDVIKGTVRSKHGDKTLYDHTFWTIIKDLKGDKIYIRPYDNLNFVKIDLSKLWQLKEPTKPVSIQDLVNGNKSYEVTDQLNKTSS